MYAAIRQGKARTGMAEELARRIKEGAIPIISDVEGFMAYYVVYAPDDTVTAISVFNNFAGAEEANRRALAWIEQNLGPLLVGPATAVAGPGDRAYPGIAMGSANCRASPVFRRSSGVHRLRGLLQWAKNCYACSAGIVSSWAN
jgi:hypothetical protein